MKSRTLTVVRYIILLFAVIYMLTPNTLLSKPPSWTEQELYESSMASFESCMDTPSTPYYHKEVLWEVSKTQQKLYCSSFVSYSKNILEEYQHQIKDERNFSVFLTADGKNNLCGEKPIIACAYLSKPYIYIKPSYFYPEEAYAKNYKPLKQVIAHEYIHTLTSKEESEWLNANKHLFKNANNVEPVEIIADCGISYFTEAEKTTGYLPDGCYKKEWKRIAIKIIENTLIEKSGYLML